MAAPRAVGQQPDAWLIWASPPPPVVRHARPRAPAAHAVLRLAFHALPPAQSFAPIFIKFDGVDGESVDSQHRLEVELVSYSWGARQKVTFASDGRVVVGRGALGDLNITHRVDVASPALLARLFSGKVIPSARLTVRRDAFERVAAGFEFFRIYCTVRREGWARARPWSPLQPA